MTFSWHVVSQTITQHLAICFWIQSQELNMKTFDQAEMKSEHDG